MRTPRTYLEEKERNGKRCRCHLRNHTGQRKSGEKRLTKCPEPRDRIIKTKMPSTTSSHASSNSSRKRTAPTSGKKSKSKARKRGQSTSRTRAARNQPNQTINQSESAERTRPTPRVQTTFLRRKHSTLLKLKIFLDDEESDNLEEFTKKTKTLLRVLQQEDELIFLAKYWISPNNTDAGKLTRPGSVLARPS